MAVYAIGDVQGCHDELRRLLDALSFDPGRDRLWLVGDLVNRGPRSVETLRLVKSLGPAAVTVLGNHDLHAVAVASGAEPRKSKDTLDALLDAPDATELMDWLRTRPLLHHDPALGWAMVHAGLPPEWDLAEAAARAAEVETVLAGEGAGEFLRNMYGDRPERWAPDLAGHDRLRFITNCFTRIRYCRPDGSLDLDSKGPPGAQPPGHLPWFRVPGRRSAGERLVFGHWSTLGAIAEAGVRSLDTGCVWGGRLTALRLDDPDADLTSVDCPGALRPGE